VITKCLNCVKSFYTKPNWVKKGGGKYCSLTCKYKSSKKGKSIPCFVCGKLTYHQNGRIKLSKSKKYFCSKSCQTVWRNSYFVGEKHSNYKDGRSTYRDVLTRNKVLAICKLCKNKDKRVLAGHHLNKDKTDNRVENLVWLCHNCHHLVHHYGVEAKKLMVAIV
jgi:hypothetical protein